MAQHEPVAGLVAMEPPERTVSEILAFMPKTSSGVIDGDFATDVEAVIEAHRDAVDASNWD